MQRYNILQETLVNQNGPANDKWMNVIIFDINLQHMDCLSFSAVFTYIAHAYNHITYIFFVLYFLAYFVILSIFNLLFSTFQKLIQLDLGYPATSCMDISTTCIAAISQCMQCMLHYFSFRYPLKIFGTSKHYWTKPSWSALSGCGNYNHIRMLLVVRTSSNTGSHFHHSSDRSCLH